MPIIKSVSNIKQESAIIKRQVDEAVTQGSLKVLRRRAMGMVRSVQPGTKTSIRKSARREFKSINNLIRKKSKKLSN